MSSSQSQSEACPRCGDKSIEQLPPGTTFIWYLCRACHHIWHIGQTAHAVPACEQSTPKMTN